MKSLRILGPYEFTIVELEIPAPAADEVLVKLEYAAVCNQNDCNIFHGTYGDLVTYPCEPGYYGHEGVGIVVEAGARVDGLRTEDRVVMTLEGGPWLYREYVTRKAESVVRIDPGVDPKEAAVLELFGCARHCLRIAGELSGRSVAVIGLGAAGSTLLQLMKLTDVGEVHGVELSVERMRKAQSFGLDSIVDARDEEQMANLAEKGIDLVIDAAGTPNSIPAAFELSRKDVVIFGFTNEPVTVRPSVWFQKEMVIKTSRRQTIDDLRDVVRLLEAGKIHPGEMIDDVMTFSKYDKAVSKIHREKATKMLLTWEEQE